MKQSLKLITVFSFLLFFFSLSAVLAGAIMHLFMLLNPLVIAFSKCYTYTSTTYLEKTTARVLNIFVLSAGFLWGMLW